MTGMMIDHLQQTMNQPVLQFMNLGEKTRDSA